MEEVLSLKTHVIEIFQMGVLVFCYNEKNEELIFPSINAARQHFKVRWTLIKKNLDTNKYTSIYDEN
jgi:hypothetical protein